MYQWTHLSFGKRKLMPQWLPEEFESLSPRTAARGADMTWRLLDQAAGQCWFAVGDAAALLDPASSHGVLRALMSGALAGQMTLGVLRRGMPGPDAARAYHTWLKDGFTADVRRLSQFYRELGADGFA